MSRFTPQRRKRNRLFRCGRKVGYSTAANAKQDMLRLIGRKGGGRESDRLQVYHCPRCKAYHVGRRPEWR